MTRVEHRWWGNLPVDIATRGHALHTMHAFGGCSSAHCTPCSGWVDALLVAKVRFDTTGNDHITDDPKRGAEHWDPEVVRRVTHQHLFGQGPTLGQRSGSDGRREGNGTTSASQNVPAATLTLSQSPVHCTGQHQNECTCRLQQLTIRTRRMTWRRTFSQGSSI